MRSNKRKGGKPNHIITAWSREDGFSLGQKVVNTKIYAPGRIRKFVADATCARCGEWWRRAFPHSIVHSLTIF